MIGKLSQMEIEAQQTPTCILQQLKENAHPLQTLATHLQGKSIPFAMTIARGSSDYAATFAKYLLETQLGLVTASSAPSVATIYKRQLQVKNALVIGISQSGKSEDICEMMRVCRAAGAITVAFVNELDSPLSKTTEYVIPLYAGKEHAVAATKSYLCSLVALTQFIAYYSKNEKLLRVLHKLPQQLETTLKTDWSLFHETYAHASSTLVIGRGYSFPIAQESALKFKETCHLQAEAFSSAEILHGPVALIKKNYPVLFYGQSDGVLQNILEVSKYILELGGKILLAIPQDLIPTELQKVSLPLPPHLHPICDPIIAIQAFYPAMAHLTQQRGFNPDQPRYLKKVTTTKKSMTTPIIIKGPKLYTENAILPHASLTLQKGKIIGINHSASKEAMVYEFPSTYHLVPGFIDLQLHGAKGSDVMDAASNTQALQTITKALPEEGTTSFLACTMTETDAVIQSIMRNINTFCSHSYMGAEIVGVHLEGPFISPQYVGAQRANAVIPANFSLFKKWNQLSGDRIKAVTFAPEVDHDFILTRALHQAGILASIGHTNADYDTAIQAIIAGCTTATHLFNAMRSLHHRQPNAITALLLAPEITAQLIIDGIHLHPAIVKFIYQLKGKEKIVLVTDAISAKGSPDGEYMLGGQKVYVKNREARLADNTLAGATLTMRDAIVNMMHFVQIPFSDALHMATIVPAKMLGLANRKGSIALGKDADIVVLDDHYQVVMTVCRGNITYHSPLSKMR